MNITISLGQMAVHAGEPDKNLDRVRSWTAEASRRGSDIVVFPELWDTGYALDRASELGSLTTQGRFKIIGELAQQHQINVVGSMLEYNSGTGSAYNTLVWFTPDGEAAGIYRKMHLFRLMDEHKYLEPGSTKGIVNTPFGQAGVAICYDLRFPELFRNYALAGVRLAIIPAEWPHPRLNHWRTLLRARAIENQMIIAGCNRVGTSGRTDFCGHSVLLDAWGEAVIEGGEDETLLTAKIDLSEVERVRQKIPVFNDRRAELYD